MPNIRFTDNSREVKEKIRQAVIEWLFESAGELEAQVKRNTRVDTGQLKGSWTYTVDESKPEAMVGSPLENAIWEEFGTGEYALNGDGRQTPWRYKDRRGDWHTTSGKAPSRAFYRAYTSCRNRIISALQEKMRRLR